MAPGGASQSYWESKRGACSASPCPAQPPGRHGAVSATHAHPPCIPQRAVYELPVHAATHAAAEQLPARAAEYLAPRQRVAYFFDVEPVQAPAAAEPDEVALR